jgi:hypothetical protein
MGQVYASARSVHDGSNPSPNLPVEEQSWNSVKFPAALLHPLLSRRPEQACRNLTHAVQQPTIALPRGSVIEFGLVVERPRRSAGVVTFVLRSVGSEEGA